MKKALILGITGQDGSYLADYLLTLNYDVHGMYRRSSTGNTRNIDHIRDEITLHQGDLSDVNSISNILDKVAPDEIYNEADQDNVGWSYSSPGYSCEVTGSAVARILELLRMSRNPAKFFQPCTAMMFGPTTECPQTEQTKFNPMSPYACAKAMAYYFCKMYRDHYGLFVATGIFYNHDSPRRTTDYLVHKIARAAVDISVGHQKTLAIGDLDTLVDIGYAGEYMMAAHSIMQLPKPDDFIISSGKCWTIDKIVQRAFEEAGILDKYPSCIVKDPTFKRPETGTTLFGDYTKARTVFKWNPYYDALEMVTMLVQHFKVTECK